MKKLTVTCKCGQKVNVPINILQSDFGKKRWKGISKKERSKIMSKVASGKLKSK